MITNPIKANAVTAINDDVLITDMHMGEMKTETGIIIGSDNGKNHGIKPRWGKVYAVGPDQTDVKVGDWILVEHGRWTRKFAVELAGGEVVELQKVETKSILGWSDEEPDVNYFAQEYRDGQGYDIDPSVFMDQGHGL
jgi:co-chaperonin GroES (HSP10)